MGRTPTHKYAIYDMDRTVTRRGTYTPFLLHVALRRAPWRLALIPFVGAAMLGYALKLVSRKRLKEINQALLIGRAVPLAALQPHIESYAERVIAGNLYQDAARQMDKDRAEGFQILWCTASYELYVRAIAARLGLSSDDVIGTKLLHDDKGRVLAKIDGENCYDAAKVGRIRQELERRLGRPLALVRGEVRLRAYSDHISDIPMLEMADIAIATTPSKALRREAEQRGWPVLDFAA